VGADVIPLETAQQIANIMNPVSSQVLSRILNNTEKTSTEFSQIRSYIDTLEQKQQHPIYWLRELAFTLTEHILKNSPQDLKKTLTTALTVIESQLGKPKAEKIKQACQAVPDDVKLITIIRKLTHLSADDWRAGPEENCALDCIEEITKTLLA